MFCRTFCETFIPQWASSSNVEATLILCCCFVLLCHLDVNSFICKQWSSRRQQTAKKRSPCLGVARVLIHYARTIRHVHPLIRAWCAIDQKFLGDENQLSKDQDLALLVQSDAVGQHDFKLAASSSSVSKKKQSSCRMSTACTVF